jgi:hypothetical protein
LTRLDREVRGLYIYNYLILLIMLYIQLRETRM